MKKNKLYKLSIGIPAYNEEEGIENLLNSIHLQKQKSYVIEKIIVASDGSTDNTESIVSKISKKKNNVMLVPYKKREGKAERLNNLLKLNKSEILLILDADTILSEIYILEKLFKYFKKAEVGIVGLNMKPVNSEKLIGKLINTWYQLWYEVRKNVNGGDSIHNIRGGAFAIRKSLAQEIQIHKNIQQVGRLAYLTSHKKGFTFAFAKDAIILYRAPDNLSDYISTLTRGDNIETNYFEKAFGKEINKQYSVPRENKIKALLKMIIKNPAMLILSFLFINAANILARNKKSLDNHGFWQIASSTKRSININF